MNIQLPEQGEPGGWMVHAMYISMGRRHDYRKALGIIQSPTLVIHGAQDIQSEAVSRSYAEILPNASFQVIENATHFPFEEQPEAFAQTITSWTAWQTK